MDCAKEEPKKNVKALETLFVETLHCKVDSWNEVYEGPHCKVKHSGYLLRKKKKNRSCLRSAFVFRLLFYGSYMMILFKPHPIWISQNLLYIWNCVGVSIFFYTARLNLNMF